MIVHPPYRWQRGYRRWLDDRPPEPADELPAVAVENMFPLRAGPRRGDLPRGAVPRGPGPGRQGGARHEPRGRRGPRPRGRGRPARRPTGPRPPLEQRREGVGLAPAARSGDPRSRPVPRGAGRAGVRRRGLARDRSPLVPRRRRSVAPHPRPQPCALCRAARARGPRDRPNLSSVEGVKRRRNPISLAEGGTCHEFRPSLRRAIPAPARRDLFVCTRRLVVRRAGDRPCGDAGPRRRRPSPSPRSTRA